MDASKALPVELAAVGALGMATACSSSGSQQEALSPSAAVSSAEPAADHNAVDVKFVDHMIPYRQQAIEMSDIILAKSGIDACVSDLATQIKAVQRPEIQQMQDWLTQLGMPTIAMTPGMGMPGMGSEVPALSQRQGRPSSGMQGAGPMPRQSMVPSVSMMPRMSEMPGREGMPGMAGMMSPADMAALKNAQGVAASKLFLTQMISHHEGAITMADKEIKKSRFPGAITVAESIVASQQKEIDTMNQILTLLG